MCRRLAFPQAVQALEDVQMILEVYRQLLLESDPSGELLKDSDPEHVARLTAMLWSVPAMDDPLVFRHWKNGRVMEISFFVTAFDEDAPQT